MRSLRLPILSKDAFFATVFTFILTGLLYILFVNFSILDPFEATFKDFRFTDIYYAKGMNKKEYNPKIVLVNIDQANRFEIAAGIDKIKALKPAAIGLDIIFKERRSSLLDSLLKDSFSGDIPIVHSYYRESDSVVQNHPYFETPLMESGYINLELSTEYSRVIREFQGVRKTDDSTEFSFAVRLAMEAGWIDQAYPEKELKRPMPIKWIGNQDSFMNYTLEEIIENPKINTMEESIVILGYLGPQKRSQFDIEDKHFTPLNPIFIGRSVPDMFGVVIHANILNMLKNHLQIKHVSPFWTYILAFIITYFTVYIGMRIYRRSNLAYDITVKVIQLGVSAVIVYIGLLLLNINVYLVTLPVVILAVFGIEFIDFYVYLVEYLNKKFGWKSSML
ncbi:CHASE2 domain-containing protein [Robiginitalea sp. IMCC44478]|uniref:CHASE2 domain-containing protein n=1 Tax=Robiginitalea sp. IMCC44478 TaxID=3459122 RepID=UPI004041D037